MDMFLITQILDLAYVQNYMRSLSQNKTLSYVEYICSLSSSLTDLGLSLRSLPYVS